jgi:uncharacterized membrane protein
MDYQLLLLVHILAGMAWVGGAIVLQATLLVARRSGDPTEVDRVMRSLGWADTWLALPAPLVVLATGAAMVISSAAWSFTQAWILISIGLVVVYELVAMTVGGRLYRRIAATRASGELDGAAHARTMAAWGRLSALLRALLVVAVGLMVFKPGVG